MGTCESSAATLVFFNPDGTVPSSFEAQIQWHEDGHAVIACNAGVATEFVDATENIRCVEGGV